MAVPDQIMFVNAPAEVGQVTLRTSEEETRMAFLPNGPDGEAVTVLTTSRNRQVRREEIVRMRESVPERMRVTFIEEVSTIETNGQKERTVGPLAGHTFEVERKSPGASVGVFDPSGSPARFGIAAQVTGQYRQFGGAPSSQAELPVGPQRIGQHAPELAHTLIAAVSGAATISAVEVPAVTLVDILPGAEGALHGLYRVDVKVTGSSGGSKVTMNLTGTMILRDKDGALLDVRLQGPVTSGPDTPDGADPDPNVPAGAGEFKLSQTMAYARS